MTSLLVVFVVLAALGQTRGLLVNIAKGGTVTQSSVVWAGVPERAVDVRRFNIYRQRSCTHTRREAGPWWRLDLQKTFSISTVTVTNRRDCCHGRIDRAEIHIGDSLQDHGNGNPRCAVISSLPAGGSVTFECKGMEGRYVNIVIPGRRKILTLCEVEVTGTEASPDVCG
ncbi:fucolectin-1-like isoform X2 [Pseudoliparis swirei]|nr:fucolectin-1-like isoform X2 [Pseudoliparis swirei]